MLYFVVNHCHTGDRVENEGRGSGHEGISGGGLQCIKQVDSPANGGASSQKVSRVQDNGW